MANKESILGFIGLARKAGKVASGTDSVIKALTNGSAKLLIVYHPTQYPRYWTT